MQLFLLVLAVVLALVAGFVGYARTDGPVGRISFLALACASFFASFLVDRF